MLPHLSNTLALWALLGIPAIIAIHFLQHKTKKSVTATLFLLEALAPEDKDGRVWDRLRTSRAFWLQILAVLLITWVLAEPVYPRENAGQTVVFVMDESADMEPFRDDAIAAVTRDMKTIRSSGIPTTWVLMGSRSSGMTYYRGDQDAAAIQALNAWQPGKSTHDFAPALRIAHALAGKNGISRLVTCSDLRVPKGQSAIGLGRPVDNIGFAGIVPAGTSFDHWKITIRNNTPRRVAPVITIRTGDDKQAATQTLYIAPEAIAEFSFKLPEGCDRATLQLPQDAFSADNVLLLQREIPKPVTVKSNMVAEEDALFRKIWGGLPGFTATAAPNATPLMLTHAFFPEPGVATIVMSQTGEKLIGSLTAEQHPLTNGLNWNGLLIPTAGSLKPGPRAQILLWCNDTPLAWLDDKALFLNWPWRESNADRMPATLLLARRFMEAVQEQAPGTTYGNLPAGSLLTLPKAKSILITKANGEQTDMLWSGRLPEHAACVEIRGADAAQPTLFKGTVWFADARMGDFYQYTPFDTGLPDRQTEIRRQMKPDPFVPLWLILIALCLLGSWWPTTLNRSRRS